MGALQFIGASFQIPAKAHHFSERGKPVQQLRLVSVHGLPLVSEFECQPASLVLPFTEKMGE